MGAVAVYVLLRRRRRNAAKLQRKTEDALVFVQRRYCELCGERCAEHRYCRSGAREGEEVDDDVESESMPFEPSLDVSAHRRELERCDSICVPCAERAGLTASWEKRAPFRMARRRVRGAIAWDDHYQFVIVLIHVA